MKITSVNTVRVVHAFNNLLLDACHRLGCVFVDVFRDFLDCDEIDYCGELYRDDVHCTPEQAWNICAL